MSLCSVAEEHFEGPPCPALGFADGRYWCGMVLEPGRHLARVSAIRWLQEPEAQAKVDEYLGYLIGTIIGVGQGCGCEDDEDSDEGDGDGKR